VIIKDSSSTYLPNSRSTSHWVKLKSDYIDQLGDTLDLIIIGGYFGERHRVGLFTGQKNTDWADHISVFLLGVIARVDEMNPSRSSAIPFAKVGMGYSMDELV
jgi:ATP-dependent DNA ligase